MSSRRVWLGRLSSKLSTIDHRLLALIMTTSLLIRHHPLYTTALVCWPAWPCELELAWWINRTEDYFLRVLSTWARTGWNPGWQGETKKIVEGKQFSNQRVSLTRSLAHGIYHHRSPSYHLCVLVHCGAYIYWRHFLFASGTTDSIVMQSTAYSRLLSPVCADARSTWQNVS